MRISDWSSDVCSSDLPIPPIRASCWRCQRRRPNRRPSHSAWRRDASGDGEGLAIPFLLMEGIMASERPSYLLEQQYPYPSLRRSIWSAYGTYRSFAHSRAKAARLNRPCQISEYRVIWRSVPFRSEEHTSELQSLMLISLSA